MPQGASRRNDVNARQVARELETVAPNLTLLCVYGGSPMQPQTSALRQGVDIIVGTPGATPPATPTGLARSPVLVAVARGWGAAHPLAAPQPTIVWH